MNLTKTILLTSLLVALAEPAIAFEWRIFPVDTGAKPALDIQPSDNFPHISYTTEDLPGFIRHAEWNGGGFDITEVASGYFYGPLDLVVIARLDTINGFPEIAEAPHSMYHDHQGDTFSLDRGDQTHAFQPSQFSPFWITQAVDDEGHDGWDNSVATFGGILHTASIDPAQFGSTDGVEYWGGEDVEAIGSGPVDYEYGTSIAMDTGGNPHIAYFDFSASFQKSENLKYATKIDGAWIIETVDAQPSAGKYPAIRLTPEGVPAISYYASDATTGIVRYAKREETGWITEEVDRIPIVTSGNTGARNLTDLDYAPSGNAVVSYASHAEVRLATKRSSGWLVETPVSAPNASQVIGALTILRVDAARTAHIAYYEISEDLFNSDSAGIPTGTVYYARGIASSNTLPVFANLEDASTDEGVSLNLTVDVTDADNDEITISATGLPEGAMLDGSTLRWTTGFTQSGLYEVTIIASDGTGDVSQSITITVAEAKAPVILSAISPTTSTLIAPAGDNLTFDISVSDEDGDTPSISWSLNGMTVEGETGTTLSIPATDAAEDIVVVTATDGVSTPTRTWTISRSLKGDFNGSGSVDFTDFLNFAAVFGQTVESVVDPIIDIDGSGTIDFNDFLIFASFFGVSI